MSGKITDPSIIAALTALRGEDGRIDPEAIVNAARSKNSPLHDQFEWDDGAAAEQYRIWQARDLLRVCVTVLPGTSQEIRAFVSLSSEKGYRSTGQVLVNANHRSQLLSDALDDMRRFEAKYRHLSELADVIAAMNRAQKLKLAG